MDELKLSKEAYDLARKPAELREFLAEHPEVKVDLFKDADGDTSLLEASRYNIKESVSLLLDHKADINAVSNYGNSSLIVAVFTGDDETALLLLEKRADVYIKNSEDEDALHWNLVVQVVNTTSFVLLCCGADVKNVKIDDEEEADDPVTQAMLDAAISEYNYTQDFIATTQHILKDTLTTHVIVDARIGVGGCGIYQEPKNYCNEKIKYRYLTFIYACVPGSSYCTHTYSRLSRLGHPPELSLSYTHKWVEEIIEWVACRRPWAHRASAAAGGGTRVELLFFVQRRAQGTRDGMTFVGLHRR
jgi:hypothetical protein